jgi:hypothetical protein
MEIFTQNLLTTSATPAGVPAGWQGVLCAPAAFGTGAEIASYIEVNGSVRTVPGTSVHGEKSVLLGAKRTQILRRNTMQLSGYEFGTSVDVDAPRVDVATGVPPRSRPV